MRILRNPDFASVAWKNGLGVSRVIASHPPGAAYDSVQWQVSTAEITANCPFSGLPGMDRQFTLLSGVGVELTSVDTADGVNQRTKVVNAFIPFAFRGEWTTTCRLIDGKVKVLNVMTRRGRTAASVRIPRWTGPLFCEQHRGETLLAIVLAGAVEVIAGEALLMQHDSVVFDAPSGECGEITTSGSGARMAIVRLSGR